MSLRGFTSRTTSVWTLIVLGCGARTTLDQEDFLGVGETAGRGGTSGGGSTAGGQGAGGAVGRGGSTSGGAPTGGVAGIGGSTMGGVAGIAGSGGGGAIGGKGGGGGKGEGRIRAACNGFCSPYSMACPTEAGTQDECTWQCMSDFGDAPRHCRDMTIEALDCLSVYFNPSLGCNEALIVAVDACFDIVDQAQDCIENPGPGPMPGPECSGSGYSSDVDCAEEMTCGDEYYYVSCYLVGPNQTACDCTDRVSGTSFVSDVPIDDACSYAMDLCGYPY